MAKFKLFYDNKEDIPEGLEKFYVEDGDRFKFDAEIEDTAGLKSALDRERELRKKAEKGSKGGEDKLTTAEKKELADLRKAADDREEDDLRKKGEYDKLEQRLHEDYAKKLEAADGNSTKFKTSLHKVLMENEATKAISKHKGKIAPLLPHISNHLSVVEDEDGTFSVQVMDGKEVRYSKKDPKTPMGVEELIEVDFLSNDDFAGVFDGRGHSGGGTPQGAGRGTGGAITLTREQAKDNRVYRQAQEQASKTGGRVQVVDNVSG